MKLRFKFLIISIVLSVLPLGFAGIISIRTISTELRSSANDDLVSSVQQIVKKIEGYIECISTPILLISKSIENENLGPDEITSLLKAVIHNVSSVISLRISVEGIESSLFAIRDDVSSRLKQLNIDPFSMLCKYKKIGRVSYLSELDLWITSITFNLDKIKLGRKAYLTAIIDINDLYLLIKNNNYSKAIEISIINEKGFKLIDKSMPDMTSYDVIKKITKMLSTNNSSIGVEPAVRFDGEKMLLAYGIPQNINLAVILEKKEADAYMIVQRMKVDFLMWMLIVLIFAVFAAIIVSSSLTKPIIKLFNHVNLITKEHRFDQKITIRSNDEIGHLANAFNSMNNSLFNYYQKQKQAEDALKVANETLEKRVIDRTKKLCVVNEHLQKEILIRKEAEEKAKAASLAKSSFLANMSHEIRTPMNGILGMINIVLDSKIDSDNRECLETANQSAKSLLTIINDILDFSKIEAGKIELENIGFDFRKTMDNIMDMFSFNAKNKGLDLVCYVHEDVPNYLKSDPGRLRQILTNITGNAIKFTDNGFISIKVTLIDENDTNAKLNFSISDTGIGISKKNQEKLFKSFSQTDSSITRKYGGTGLGLVISKQLIEMMGGKIYIKSEKNKGTEFWFSILFEKCNKTEIESLKAIPDNQSKTGDLNNLKNLRILLVEDVVTNQKVALRFLNKAGCKTDIASNGKEALEMIKAGSYEIVLMDIQMPVMDGIEATKIIRSSKSKDINNNIPIIAMTAHAMKGDKELFIQAGMDDYISKPIKENELLIAINRNINADNFKYKQKDKIKIIDNKDDKDDIKEVLKDDIKDNIKEDTKDNIKEDTKDDIKENTKDDIKEDTKDDINDDINEKRKIIDYNNIVMLYGDDKEFIKRLIPNAIKDIKDRTNKLMLAIKNDNLKDVTLQAHSIKGLAGSISADNLSKAAFNIEYAAKNKQKGILDSLLLELKKHFNILISYFDKNFL